MKKWIVILALLLSAATASANCWSWTLIRGDGSVLICSTCCDGYGNCTTECY